MRKRDDCGQFTQKSDTPRHVRSIRLTDLTWEKLGKTAENRNITRADLLEEIVENGVLDSNLPQTETSLREELEPIIKKVLEDSKVTRSGKDRGVAKRALDALLNQLPR